MHLPVFCCMTPFYPFPEPFFTCLRYIEYLKLTIEYHGEEDIFSGKSFIYSYIPYTKMAAALYFALALVLAAIVLSVYSLDSFTIYIWMPVMTILVLLFMFLFIVFLSRLFPKSRILKKISDIYEKIADAIINAV